MPLVSGSRTRTKKKASIENTANAQNMVYVPKASERIGNSLVNTKLVAQQHEEVTADAFALTFGGNTSAITAHGKGPKPVKQQINSNYCT